VKIVNYCNAVLMQECKDFQDFSGRDVDTFYISNNKFLNINNEENVILNQREKGSYRFLINHKDSTDFINLDVEDLSIFSPLTKIENQVHFNEAIDCNKTGLRHFKLNSIIYYKLVKYFSQGIVFSYEQLYKLKKIISSISSDELNYILSLTLKNLPQENIWIKKLIDDDFWHQSIDPGLESKIPLIHPNLHRYELKNSQPKSWLQEDFKTFQTGPHSDESASHPCLHGRDLLK